MPLPKSVTGYRFLDKDPCVDLFRYAKEKTGLSYEDISKKSGVTVATLRKWDLGSTKKPQHLTFRFVMAAMGFHERWVHARLGSHSVSYRTKS